MKKKKKNANQDENQGSNLNKNAELAMDQKFYLEAAWIMSTIFEKKMKKILVKTDPQPVGPGFTLEQSVKRVKYLLISSKYPALTDYISIELIDDCLLYTSPSPRDRTRSRMPSSA